MERKAYDLMSQHEASHWWFVARRNIIDSVIERDVNLPAQPRILEAGCGTGGNLALLGSHGEVSAFEYDPDARQIATRKSGVAVEPGALPDGVNFPDNDFDMVALLDVLEHIDDDYASLRTLREKLATGGTLLLTVPAAPWLWSEHDELHHHKRRYTKQVLEKLLADAGFRDVRVRYFNSFLFPLAVVERVLRNLGLRRSGGTDEVAPWLNRVFERIFSSEARLLDKVSFPFGLSLCAVAVR